jgi:hypothetical protein
MKENRKKGMMKQYLLYYKIKTDVFKQECIMVVVWDCIA